MGIYIYGSIIDEFYYADSYLFPDTDLDNLIQPFFAGAYYRPLISLSALLDRWLFNSSHIAANIQNIGIHLLNAYLIFLLGARFCWPAMACFFSGAVFLLHPGAPDSVSWIAGRCDLLAATFTLICVLICAGGRYQGKRRTLVWLCFILAMFSKETSFMLPVILLSLKWWGPACFRHSLGDRNVLREWSFLVGLVLLFRLLILRSSAAFQASLEHSLSLDINIILQRLSWYGLWLTGGAPDIHFLQKIPAFPGNFYGLLVTGAGTLLLLSVKTTRWGWIWCWFFIFPSLLIEESLRYLYLPVCGWSLMLGSLAATFLKKPGIRKLNYWIVPLLLITLISMGLKARVNARNWERIRHSHAFLAKKIYQTVPELKENTQVFVYGHDRKVKENALKFEAKVSQQALQLISGDKTLKWLSSLSEYNLDHPLNVYFLEKNSLEFDPGAAQRINQFLNSSTLPEKTRDPENREIPELTYLSGNSVLFSLPDSAIRFPYLRIRAFLPENPPKRSLPRAALYWQYHPSENWDEMFRVLQPIRRNNRGDIECFIYLGTALVASSEEIYQFKLELPWNMSLPVRQLSLSMVSNPTSTHKLQFKHPLMKIN